jgi:hypothetical protein
MIALASIERRNCEAGELGRRLVMIDGFEMIPELFTADGDALLDQHIGFDLGERVSFNGVRGVGQFKVVGCSRFLSA